MSEKKPNNYSVIVHKEKNVYLATSPYSPSKDNIDDIIDFCTQYRYSKSNLAELIDFFTWQKKWADLALVPHSWKNTTDNASAIENIELFNQFLNEVPKYFIVQKNFIDFFKRVYPSEAFKKNYRMFDGKNLEKRINDLAKNKFPIFQALSPFVKSFINNGFNIENINHLEEMLVGTGYAVFNKDGFEDPQHSSGSLNKAKIFSTPEMATKFASDRFGKLPSEVAIVKVNVEAFAVYHHTFRTLPEELLAVQREQEKKQLTIFTDKQDIEGLQTKLAEYEKILQKHNLLDDIKLKQKKQKIL